jgi:hypothetical protein
MTYGAKKKLLEEGEVAKWQASSYNQLAFLSRYQAL